MDIDTDAAAKIIAVMIPIVAIVMGIGIGMLGLWLDYRKKRDIFELHHKERMAAIEKGMEVPPLPPELFTSRHGWRRRPQDHLRVGLMLLFIGVAVTAALYVQDRDAALWGLVLVAIGLARLIFYAVVRKHPEGQDGNPNDLAPRP